MLSVEMFVLGCYSLFCAIHFIDAEPFRTVDGWLTACWEWIYRHSGAEWLDDRAQSCSARLSGWRLWRSRREHVPHQAQPKRQIGDDRR